MASRKVDWKQLLEADAEQDARIEELKKVSQESFCYVVPSVSNSENFKGSEK